MKKHLIAAAVAAAVAAPAMAQDVQVYGILDTGYTTFKNDWDFSAPSNEDVFHYGFSFFGDDGFSFFGDDGFSFFGDDGGNVFNNFGEDSGPLLIFPNGRVLDFKSSAKSRTARTTRMGSAFEGLSGNRLGVRGTEDLGGGLKAAFVVELGISNQDQWALGSQYRLANATVSGGFGSVNLGRAVSVGKAVNDSFTAFGGGGAFTNGSAVVPPVK
jgi:predicted porin